MLSLAPFAEQVEYFKGDPTRVVQRWAGAAVVTLLASTKLALLSAGAVTFPFWWPWVQAADKNRRLLDQSRYIGLWRTRVLSVEVQGRRLPRFTEPSKNGAQPPPMQQFQPYLQLLVGDDSGARTELSVPYVSRHDEVREGDSAELLVVASKPTFEGFKALKEAYLPESSLWIADYPYVNKDTFLDLSLAIERERRVDAAESSPAAAQL